MKDSGEDFGRNLLLQRLEARDRWRYGRLLGTPGYQVPEIARLERVTSGIVLRGPAASSAVVLGSVGTARPERLGITLHDSAENCLVVIGPDTPVTGEITVIGARATIIFGGKPGHASPIAVTMWREDELFFWGAGSTANGLRVVIHGHSRSVIVGEDCMFANDTFLRASDMHGIVDMVTGEQAPCHGDILLEPHVWIGQETTVLKNTAIGFGTVVGAKSLVVRSIPRLVLAAGQPARVLRQQVSWNRMDEHDPGLLCRLRAMEAQLDFPTSLQSEPSIGPVPAAMKAS